MKFHEYTKKLQSLPEKQKLVIIFTIVIIVGLILGFFWIKDAANSISKIGSAFKSAQLPNLDTPTTDQPVVVTEPAPTTDWKTYTNEKYGFEIQYPAKLDFNGEHLSLGGEGNVSVQIFDINSETGKSLIQDIEKKNNEIILNGKNAWQVKGLGTSNYYFIETYVNSDKYIYEIQYSDVDDKQVNHVDILNQMLSTFKFTN